MDFENFMRRLRKNMSKDSEEHLVYTVEIALPLVTVEDQRAAAVGIIQWSFLVVMN